MKNTLICFIALFVCIALGNNADTVSAQGTSCHLLLPGASILSGFGAPYDVVLGTNSTLLSATCDNGTARIKMGDNNRLRYIYELGYE